MGHLVQVVGRDMILGYLDPEGMLGNFAEVFLALVLVSCCHVGSPHSGKSVRLSFSLPSPAYPAPFFPHFFQKIVDTKLGIATMV